MAHDVFISYSSKDKSVADAACALLEARGIRCWMAPRDILPGSEWGAAIVGAIGSSKVMVLIYTSSSNASPQVRREVERAVARGLHVIPFRVEDVPMSPALEYFISSPHWLDALSPPLERHLDHLARIIKAVLDAQNAGADGSSAVAPALAEPAPAAPAGGASSGWSHGPPPGSFVTSAASSTAPASKPARLLPKSRFIIGGGVAALVVGVVIFAATRPGDDDAGKPQTAINANPPPTAAPQVNALPADPEPEVTRTPKPEPKPAERLPSPVVVPVTPAPPAAKAGADDVKRFWELLAQGSPRIPRIQELLDTYPKLVNAKNVAGNTPLYEAAKSGQLRVVSLLLESGADRKATNYGGNTALHGAAEGGLTDPQVIEQLAPGNLDARNGDVRTALHVAAALGNAETARLIAEAGANLNVLDKSGRTPLQLAMALDDAAKAHATTLALVNAGAKTEVADKRGNTPLHFAAGSGDATLLGAMIDKGAKVDRAGAVGRTPLHVAAIVGKPDAIKALVARRAALDVVDDQGNTALHLAATLKDTAAAEALLAAGAKVTTATVERRTPLHVAAAAGNTAMVELFMRNGGSDVLMKGATPTPVEVAEKAGKTETAQLLRRLEFPAMLSSAIKSVGKPVPPRLLEMIRKDPKLAGPQGQDGRNALHLCATSGNAAFAAELIKIDPGLVRGFSAGEEQPLHLAAQYKQTAVAKVLLAAGASVRATVRNGDTPLHLAARAGAGETAKALLDAGADPDIANKQRQRPADVAGDAATRSLLAAAETEANTLRDAWAAVQLEGRGYSVKAPGLAQPLRLRFRDKRNFTAEGDVDGAFKSFAGTYMKGALTLTMESADGPLFPGIPGTTYSAKVNVTDESRFSMKVGNAEVTFER